MTNRKISGKKTFPLTRTREWHRALKWTSCALDELFLVQLHGIADIGFPSRNPILRTSFADGPAYRNTNSPSSRHLRGSEYASSKQKLLTSVLGSGIMSANPASPNNSSPLNPKLKSRKATRPRLWVASPRPFFCALLLPSPVQVTDQVGICAHTENKRPSIVCPYGFCFTAVQRSAVKAQVSAALHLCLSATPKTLLFDRSKSLRRSLSSL